MGKRFTQQNGESRAAFQQRIGAIQSAERRDREAVNYRAKRFKRQARDLSRIDPRAETYETRTDDLGESPDF